MHGGIIILAISRKKDQGTIIRRLDQLDPHRFSVLLAESEASDYRFLRRVADEWESGANRFARLGEALLAAEIDGRLIGVCGLSIDPYLVDDRVGRVRNVYVLVEYRGRGIGRRLVETAISAAKGRFDRLRLRAEEPGPARLYESLGFLACSGIADCTHILDLAGDTLIRSRTSEGTSSVVFVVNDAGTHESDD
jgi:GNAT superfamily N-acetyltransferase